MTARTRNYPQLYLRIMLRADARFGPGKADMLEGIADLGSIAAAGRRMRMSYKRAWELVGELNECCDLALVNASKGGKGGGGARLTPLGRKMLKSYRAMQANSAIALHRELAFMRRHSRFNHSSG